MSGVPPVRVLYCCTGVGILNRGIETFFRDAFDGLKDAEGTEVMLVKGAPDRPTADPREKIVPCLKRTGPLAALIGKITGRSAYTVEQWSSLPAVIREIQDFRPQVVFTSEANLMFLLRRLRGVIGVPFQMLYSNGGPCHPPFDRHDFVHQVAPFYRDEALAAGEPAEKHLLVPYGIRTPEPPTSDPAEKRALRERLGLPTDRPILLSVGWIARQHKRMDYVIEEVAALPEPRPFLQLLGAMDAESEELVALAREKLGAGNFAVASVPPEAVADYYRAADAFVLGSLVEGFGRVYLEALSHGLPTIGHRHPVIEYVLGDAGIVADLSKPGGLSALLENLPWDSPHRAEEAMNRWRSIRDRFSWEVLSRDYVAMFRSVATPPVH